MRVTLRCTLSQSVLSGCSCVQHDMLRTQGELTDSQLGADSEPWYNRYVYRAQANKQGLRHNRNGPHGQEKNNKDAVTHQHARRNNLVNVGR